MQVAIDGPASAGKSTVAKIIAKKLDFIYIDTGAMYRACTFIARKENIDYGDEAHILAAISQNKIEFKSENGEQRVYVAGEDVSLAIRTPEITANVSQVSALKGVREKMVELQREMAGSTNVIMDGRDIGTTVLPDAELKIFLVASVHSRAKRRLLDYAEKGIHEDLAKIEHDIAERDYKDSHRAISPLKKADDAVEVDTTNMSIDEVVSDILAKIKAKMAK
ncbi:(d)CMP kinase [Lactobacillus mulieris]|jgi:cytidylate kinase|uniref:(d)CMP kinase n=1 Tax=Lactobacillus mulieris TaxID=2508708 RepID=UPI0001B2AE85|nr:(d)CMP kinase [Lactobacillus mulieris]EEU21259.1 cytidylate kinase [Lactobacillus jensenii 27-2-CHN]EEX24134.1 cytidylate kinase [Lactobacillus jensenii 115-3-CHN]KAA9371775.1 (d)CMP kinase [Lactobacillus jensenii]MCF1784138.1 (d)CMP kinase [Lactobacillus mulieris]MCF1847578.1 (d)CMP kinase [Lactobacillus mulieris]